MSLSESLYAHLTTHAGLASLVASRVYPVYRPLEAPLPAVTYQVISAVPPPHPSGSDPPLKSVRVQVDSWGATYASVLAVAAEVRSALRDYSGVMGGDGGTVVERSFWEGESELYEAGREGAKGLFRVSADFIIWVAEG